MRDDHLRTIADGLSLLAHKLEGRASARLFDLHLVSEHFVQEFLNRLRSLKLENLNTGRTKAFPAIDLGDKRTRIAFQITTDKSRAKIIDSLKTFLRHNLHRQYGKIVFVILRRKQISYAPIRMKGLRFNSKTDVIDVYDLIRELDTCKTPTLRQLRAILVEEELATSSWTAEPALRDVRELMTIDRESVSTQKQLVFFNSGSKNIRNVWLGSFLMSEDGSESEVLYDEKADSIGSKEEVRQGDILTGDGRSNFVERDLKYYKSTLNDRIKAFLARTTGKIRLFAVVRAIGDSPRKSMVAFWSSEHFDHIELAAWHHIHDNESGLYTRAQQIADHCYRKRLRSLVPLHE